MNLLNKLTLRNLRLNIKRTIVTVIGIILSVALITAVASMYASVIKSLITYETSKKGNFHVAFFDVCIDDIGLFNNNRKIEEINLTKKIGYAKIDSKNEYKPYAYVSGFTSGALKNLSVNVIEGRLPENENEIVIPTHLKTNGRVFLKVGDTITLNVGKRVEQNGHELGQSNPFNPSDGTTIVGDAKTGEMENISHIEKSEEKIIDAKEITYKIVGIVERPASNVESYSAPGYTFITYIDESKISGNIDVYARFTKEGVNDRYKVISNILGVDEEAFRKGYSKDAQEGDFEQYIEAMEKAKYEIDINSYLITLETNPFDDSAVGGLGIVVGIVMGIIIFTSVFCIKNSFDISITEKTKQYGMLRSVGATKKQIKQNVFYEASILGMIGIPLGILSGFLAAFLLVIISNCFMKDIMDIGIKLEFNFSYILVVIAVILGIVTIYFSAFNSSIRASRVVPIDLIRNSANIKINPKKIKAPRVIKKVFGIGGEISYKNLKRNRKKYRTTVISIAVSVFVFIALSSFMGIAFDEIQNELKINEYNVSLYFYNFQEEIYGKLLDISKLDNIEDYSIIKSRNLLLKDVKLNKEYRNWTKIDVGENDDIYIEVVSLNKEQYLKYIKSLGLNYDNTKDKAILCDYYQIDGYDEKIEKSKYKLMHKFDYKAGDVISGSLSGESDEYKFEIAYIAKERPFGLKNAGSAKLIISDEAFDKNYTSKMIYMYFISSNADKLHVYC